MQPDNIAELERSVLGGLLLLADEPVPPWASAVEPATFSNKIHQSVMTAIDELIGAGDPVDTIAVADKLSGWGVRAGSLLTEISTETPTAANLEYYARRLVEHSQLTDAWRRIDALAANLHALPFGSVREGLRDVVERMRAPVSASGLRALRDTLPETLAALTSERSGSGGPICRTGLAAVDRWLRLEAGALSILAARPSMGKTALAVNIARNACKNLTAGPVAIYSLEMRVRELVRRLLASESRSASDSLPEKAAAGALVDAAATLHQLDLWIDDRPGLSIDEMRAGLRKLPRPQLVIVDYLGLARFGKEERHDLRVGAVTKGLKALAKDFDCHVLALSQLNRDVEKRSPPYPRLSDLRDSGNIEEDADNVLLLYRPGYYYADADQTEVEIEIAKQRNGPTRGIKIRWNRDIQLFSDF